MNAKIIPTVFAYNKKQYEKRLEKLLPLSKELQVDFMDGLLGTKKGLLPININDLPKNKFFEAHMMVAQPQQHIQEAAQKGFSRYLFHIESQHTQEETKNLIQEIKKAKMKPGLVLNPTTPIARIKPFIKDIDVAMLMGHNIGVEGVSLSTGIYNKIRHLHEQFPNLTIEVDGGVTQDNAYRLVQAGATRLSVGSAISNEQDPKKALQELQKSIQQTR